jgi:hypothetical protein
MANKNTLAKALITLKLSAPSKMPGYTMALPANHGCPTGSKLRGVKGSVCEHCYACKGRYVFGPAKTVREYNLDSVRNSDAWVNELAQFLIATKQPEFRFHDSGDIQDIAHLTAIVKLANMVPSCKFWVPTKEYATVRAYLKANGSFPSNLCVRISAPMVGKCLSETSACGLPTSSVGTGKGFTCPVKNGLEKCDTYNCRACWDCKVTNIDYRQH